MTSKKIALIGTSCVGKTSILDELKSVFRDHVFINEVAREYFLRQKSKNRFSFQDQKNIQDLAIRTEKNMTGKIIICDRSVICPIIYTNAAGDVSGGRELFSRIKDWVPTYTQLLLLDPSEVPYKKDTVRNEDNLFRMKVHSEYLVFLAEKKIQYTLITGTRPERIAKITKIINSYNYA